MHSPDGFTIELAHDSPREAAARDLLLDLMETYDLSRWRYTDRIRISDTEIPHSHPVLTISGHADLANPLRLVASYLHEQLHWFWLLEEHGERLEAVRLDLEKAYPDLPVEPPMGCGSSFSNYLHIAINYWELEGLAELVDVEVARSFLAGKPFYTAIYQLVLAETERIGDILAAQKLVVPPQPPAIRRFLPVIDGRLSQQ